MIRRPHPLAVLLLTAGLAVGCGVRGPANPSFDVSLAEAREALTAMEAEPRPLERPVVLLAGWADPGVAVAGLERRLRQVVSDNRILAVNFFGADSFEGCRDRVLEAVAEAFGEGREVDVVAISMGGLVARHAAANPSEDGDRLHIVRLFTIATPHQGARLAELPQVDPMHEAMRPGSAFLDSLPPVEELDYPIYPYVRLDDVVVGATRAGTDQPAWWLANRAFEPAHLLAYRDERIVAEIARHLRGEEGWAQDPPTPVPSPFRGD